MKVLSPAQAAELIRNEPDPMWRLNWLLAFATGLRQGERLGLTMDELTTLNGRRALVIDHQLQRVPDSGRADWPLGEDVTDLGNGFWLCPPKTDSGERIVVLDDVMCGALDEWLAIRKQKGVDLPRAVRHLVMQPLPLHVDLEQVAFLGEPEVREHQPVRQTPVGRDDRVRGFVPHRQRRPVEVPRRLLQRGGVRAVAHRQADVQPRIADRPHCAPAVRVEQPTVLLCLPRCTGPREGVRDPGEQPVP